MPFISVIIPVYKTEDYLEKCVDSILNQGLNDIEIILVDDGSPDRCSFICDAYAGKFEYIKVIHKANGGLSSARNAGIREASGQFLMFADSDDWWNPDVSMHRVINEVKEKIGVEMFLFTSLDYVEKQGYFKRDEHQKLQYISTESVKEYYRSLLKNGNLEVSACTKIIKREFVVKNNLYFKEGLLGEDNEWMIRGLRSLHSVAIIDEPLYICRQGRKGSITNSIGRKNITDILWIVQESQNYYAQSAVDKTLHDEEMCFAAYLWFCALGLSTSLSRNEWKEVQISFKNTAEVCRYSYSPKTQLCWRLYCVIGLTITRAILGMYIRLKRRTRLNQKLVSEEENKC